MTGAVALLIVEAAAIPFQVSQSVTAADSMQYFWPLLGVILLGCVGTAAIRGGRRFRRAAQRRREWAPAVRR